MTRKLLKINSALIGGKNAGCTKQFGLPFRLEQPFVSLLSNEKSMPTLSSSFKTNNNTLNINNDSNPYITSMFKSQSMVNQYVICHFNTILIIIYWFYYFVSKLKILKAINNQYLGQI